MALRFTFYVLRFAIHVINKVLDGERQLFFRKFISYPPDRLDIFRLSRVRFNLLS
jgi:hypothetical protein